MRHPLRRAALRCLAVCALLFLAALPPGQASAVVGGGVAPPETWPWVVALVDTGSAAEAGVFCGGTLISPSHVLTAAHCLAGDGGQGRAPESVEVVVGRTTLSAEGGLRVGVAGFTLHPSFARLPDGSLLNDVAVIKLAQAVSGVPTVTLAERTPAVGRVTVVGWGSTHPELLALSDELRQAELPLITSPNCAIAMAGRRTVTETMVCAGQPQGGVDACKADDGGPLLFLTTAGPRQVGIVSFSDGCAKPATPAVYTSVPAFRAWITARLSEQANTSPTPAPTAPAPRPTPSPTPVPSPGTARVLLYLPVVR